MSEVDNPMDIKVSRWQYLDQECVLAQSVNVESLEKQAAALRAQGYCIEIQPNRRDAEHKFYFLMATKKRDRWQ